MKKLLVITLVTLITAAGCVPATPVAQPVPDEPPVAYIDSISSIRIFKDETVSFSGHGIDEDGNIAAYEWRSSLDGVLSTSASFETSSLTSGNNIVYFRVQDNKGNWSKDVYRTITILSPISFKPIVKSFKASPDIITKGDSMTLTWNISGADTVNIEPDIGYVPTSGTRTVFPKTTTDYILTATNAAGSTAKEINVIVDTTRIITVETFSIVGEEGYVNDIGKMGPIPVAGDTRDGYSLQAFMSFDITMIPVGATILSSTIDLTQYTVYGEPFGTLSLGRLGIYHDQYGALGKEDFVISDGFGTDGSLISTYWRPVPKFTSAAVTDAVQKQVNAGAPRFQIRLQFDRPKYFNEQADSIEFGQGGTKLIIMYVTEL